VPTVITAEGTEIIFKDWGSGQPVGFSHGWLVPADASDGSANFVASHGFRPVAHDRRGGARSGRPWEVNDLDHYSDDLAAVIEALDLSDVVLSYKEPS
jgi:non-heme chloroperoxidase